MRDTFVGRGANPTKIEVVLNSSDEAIFDPSLFPPSDHLGVGDRDFVLLCHGAIEERYGLDTIVRAVALLTHDLPRLRLEVYGEGSQLPVVRQLASDWACVTACASATGISRSTSSWPPWPRPTRASWP
jgi:glycosyltransferase involved in cell wall biosynthesis